MGVDLRPYISDDYPNAGQSIGNTDAAWAYDCQLECLKITARDYGLGIPYSDPALRALGQPQTGNAGMLFPTIQAVVAKAFPSLASVMTIQAGNAATLRANIAKGYMQHMAFWCDANAWVPAKGPVTYSHCCRCVADTGTGFIFQNPEPHPDFELSDAQVNALTDGEGVLVFQKSLLPAAAPTFTGGSMGLVAITNRPAKFGNPNYADVFYIQPVSNHVLHAWGSNTGAFDGQEDLGGYAAPAFGVSCCWTFDGSAMIVQCVSGDGAVWTNYWNGKWNGWQHVQFGGQNLVPLAPPQKEGPPGPAGNTLDQGTINGMVHQAIAPVAAGVEEAMKLITGA